MNDLRDMSYETNQLNTIMEKYKEAVIDNFRDRLKETRAKSTVSEYDIDIARRIFNFAQSKIAMDESIGSNARWGIVGRKNFFGLSAEIFPTKRSEIKKDNRLYLKAMSGRFQMQKFASDIFPNRVNISSILGRSEDEQFSEIEEFYNMTNREVFEKYGINARNENDINLIASCVILDSLLKDRYSELKDVFCWYPNEYGIDIKLEDGTEIVTRTSGLGDKSEKKGITIRKDGKEARVSFDSISMGKNQDALEDISELEVKNVEYSGDSQLIEQLKQAMQEQFRSQQEKDKAESQETILQKQILVKKMQLAMERSQNDETRTMRIDDISEFDLLQNDMLWNCLDMQGSKIGFSSSEVVDNCQGWFTAIPVEQYIHIRLPQDKVLSIEFFGRENGGVISLKNYGERISNRDDVEDIILNEATTEQELLNRWKEYSTDLSLKELLEKKLHMKNTQMTSLEAEESTISEAETLVDRQAGKEDSDKGEK